MAAAATRGLDPTHPSDLRELVGHAVRCPLELREDVGEALPFVERRARSLERGVVAPERDEGCDTARDDERDRDGPGP
jgi:hypothetical protein